MHAPRELYQVSVFLLYLKQAVLPEVIKEAVFSAYTQLGHTAVAVRSSATTEDLPGASFAGLQETFLNVLIIEDLFIALRRCWSSLWTARALTYRAFQHIAPETVHMAVINVPGAMHFIQDGQTIEVDSSNGRVYLDITG